MTTWTTFETIAETAQRSEFAVRSFYVDRLGNHWYTKDDRTRFELRRVLNDDDVLEWQVFDLEPEADQMTWCQGSMRDCVQFIAGRVLYGARQHQRGDVVSP